MRKLFAVFTFANLMVGLLTLSSAFAIIGGKKLENEKDALANSVVAVWDTQQEFLCTGTLISQSVVITAAHCMASHPSKIRIVFGTDAFLTLNAREVDVQKEFVRKVIAGRIHEDYILDEAKQPPIDQNDLAILQFEGPMPTGYRPLPILRDQSALVQGADVAIAGYGVTSVQVTQIDLKKIDAKALALGIQSGKIRCDETNTDCVSVVTTGFSDLYATKVQLKSLSKKEVRLDESHGKSSCTGDSGGPALVMNNGTYQFFGVLSRGKMKCDFEGVYTNAARYLPWIQETLVKFEGPRTAGFAPRR